MIVDEQTPNHFSTFNLAAHPNQHFNLNIITLCYLVKYVDDGQKFTTLAFIANGTITVIDKGGIFY